MVTKLCDKGVTTLGMFAFVTSYTLGSSDDAPLDNLLTDLKNGVAGSLPEIAAIRRLTFEAQTLVTADAKMRLERTDEDRPRKMHHLERETRLKAVEAKLIGLTMSEELEVSNSLVDLCAQIADDGMLRWISPDLCTKRSQEMVGVKKADLDSLSADVQDLLRLRFAFQRRGIALEVTFLMSFSVHEK